MKRSAFVLRPYIFVFSLVAFFLSQAVHGQTLTTTYHFVGTPFNHCSDDSSGTVLPVPCTKALSSDSPQGRISGYFTLPQPLPPNLVSPNGIGGPGDFQPSSFCFTDGVTTITNTNGLTNANGGFSANTDAQGNLTQWSVGVRWNGAPPPGRAGDIRTYFGPSSGGGIVARSEPSMSICLMATSALPETLGATGRLLREVVLAARCNRPLHSRRGQRLRTSRISDSVRLGQVVQLLRLGPAGAPSPYARLEGLVALSLQRPRC